MAGTAGQIGDTESSSPQHVIIFLSWCFVAVILSIQCPSSSDTMPIFYVHMFAVLVFMADASS